jgi:N-acyl amino acid synthase of PEP-CTERM/exosortase system
LTNYIIDHFNEYYEMLPVISDELKHEVYKLRYQVYCIENEFLNSENYPDDLEFDDFDQHSVHYLIRHRRSGDYAATVRLILPNTNNPEKLFPIEQYCEINNFAVMQSIARKSLGEASRLCVSKTFKRRKNEAHTLAAIGSNWNDYFTPDEKRTFPHLSFALIACLIRACHDNNINYFFGTLEPAWFRFLSASGIHFTKIGPLMDYHGARWPGVIKVTDLLDGVAEKNLDMWNFLTNYGRLEQALAAH